MVFLHYQPNSLTVGRSCTALTPHASFPGDILPEKSMSLQSSPAKRMKFVSHKTIATGGLVEDMWIMIEDFAHRPSQLPRVCLGLWVLLGGRHQQLCVHSRRLPSWVEHNKMRVVTADLGVSYQEGSANDLASHVGSAYTLRVNQGWKR